MLTLFHSLFKADDAHGLKRKKSYDLQNAMALTEYRSLGLSPTQLRLIFQDLESLAAIKDVVPEAWKEKLENLTSKVGSRGMTTLVIIQSTDFLNLNCWVMNFRQRRHWVQATKLSSPITPGTERCRRCNSTRTSKNSVSNP